MQTIQIKSPNANAYSTVAKKDFLAALEECDGVNDIITINETQYTLSSAILNDQAGSDAVQLTVSSTVADTYVAGGSYALVAGFSALLPVNKTCTGASTVNINGSGSKAIQLNGSALVANDIQAGQNYLITYDGTAFQLRQTSSVKEKKVYKALLTQSSTDAPTAVVLENSIGDVAWTRAGAGSYAGTLISAFGTKTALNIAPPGVVGDTTLISKTSADAISVKTCDEDNTSGIATAADGILSSTLVIIEVYY